MLKKLIVIAWIGIVAVSFSCEGPQGEVGPAGAAGQKGETGAQGPKGDTGVAGKDALGAKEIITRGAVTSTNGGYTLGKSGLTSADTAMVNKSVVVVFIQSQDLWYALPGPVDFPNNQKGTFTFVTALRGTTFFIDIRPVSWTEDQATAPQRTFQRIRAVVIPSTTLRANAELDLKNYDEVVKTLNLKESDILEADI